MVEAAEVDLKMELAHLESLEEVEAVRQRLEVQHVPDWADSEPAQAQEEHDLAVVEVPLKISCLVGREAGRRT